MIKRIQVVSLVAFTFVGLARGMAQVLPDREQLSCVDQERGSVTLVLDSTGFTRGSGFSRPVYAGIAYLFSSAQDMSCDGVAYGADIDIWCVGYYSRGEVTTVTFKTLPDGSYKAEWTTAPVYGSQPRETVCVRSALP